MFGRSRRENRRDFNFWHLALAELEKTCGYCGELSDVDDLAIVYDVPPEGRHGGSASRGFTNVRACCGKCGVAKGMLSGSEFLDVRAALQPDRLGAAAAIEL